MAVKIRLQRHGKKDTAFFHLVVADGRAPRDGAFIEKLGIYNPNTNPATIELNFDSTLKWLMNGAQPSDTCRAILSYKGILMKKHLLEGVKKGALTEAQAEAKFTKWLGEKEGKIVGKKESLVSSHQNAYAEKMKAEKLVKEAKAAKITAKNTPPPAAEVAAEEEHTSPAAEEHTETKE
jgi:small subunit ribosomal protein S16